MFMPLNLVVCSNILKVLMGIKQTKPYKAYFILFDSVLSVLDDLNDIMEIKM